MKSFKNEMQGIASNKSNKNNSYFFSSINIPINNKDNKSYIRNSMNIFTQKTKKEREMEILKLEVKKILKDEHIIFTDTPLGIFIDMSFRREIVFSKDPVGYKIYTESGFELGCSSDRFMTKDDVFEALNWTILEINLDLHGNLPFNVYATNDREVA